VVESVGNAADVARLTLRAAGADTALGAARKARPREAIAPKIYIRVGLGAGAYVAAGCALRPAVRRRPKDLFHRSERFRAGGVKRGRVDVFGRDAEAPSTANRGNVRVDTYCKYVLTYFHVPALGRWYEGAVAA
jgi:hypothetical protein